MTVYAFVLFDCDGIVVTFCVEIGREDQHFSGAVVYAQFTSLAAFNMDVNHAPNPRRP